MLQRAPASLMSEGRGGGSASGNVSSTAVAVLLLSFCVTTYVAIVEQSCSPWCISWGEHLTRGTDLFIIVTLKGAATRWLVFWNHRRKHSCLHILRATSFLEKACFSAQGKILRYFRKLFC